MTLKELFAVLLLGVLCLLPQQSRADCAIEAWQRLEAIRVYLRTVPAVTVADVGHKGSYRAGVVAIRDPEDCWTMTHEFAHHWQFERWGEAKDAAEWHSREMQANLFTRQAMEGWDD